MYHWYGYRCGAVSRHAISYINVSTGWWSDTAGCPMLWSALALLVTCSCKEYIFMSVHYSQNFWLWSSDCLSQRFYKGFIIMAWKLLLVKILPWNWWGFLSQVRHKACFGVTDVMMKFGCDHELQVRVGAGLKYQGCSSCRF